LRVDVGHEAYLTVSLLQILLVDADLVDVYVCDVCPDRGAGLERAEEVVEVFSDLESLVVGQDAVGRVWWAPMCKIALCTLELMPSRMHGRCSVVEA
jgi:hypothetical protein